MSDQLLQSRQDAPIWNAIEANNFKQALKLVDKRLAKNRTPHLEAFKIYIRSRSPLQSEKDAVLAHIEDLVAKKVALTDLDDIDLYDDALDAVMPNAGDIWSRTIGELRWQAVKLLPKQEDLALKSFKACLQEHDLEHGQQIASILEKSFPNKHQYVFWNISSLFLRSISQDLPVEKRTLWGRLAYGQISKVAAATIQADNSKTLPTRAIHAPQELLLLQRIAAAHGKLEDQLKFLNEPSLGPESTVAKGDWELWRNKLQLMEQSQQWQELFDITGGLLKRARTKDGSGQIIEAKLSDWVVWQAYLNSAISLHNPSVLDKVSTEIAAHLDPTSGIDKTWRRNASLAWLEFTFKSSSMPFASASRSESKVENHPRVAATVKYLQQFGDATTAYSDLRPYVEQLEAEERGILLDIFKNGLTFDKTTSKQGSEPGIQALSISDKQFDNANTMTRCVNIHKLTYLIVSSIPEHERRSSPLHKPGQNSFVCKHCSSPCEIYCIVCLEQLAERSVSAYASAVNDDGTISESLLPTDRHPADDFCTLAAVALLKLSLSGSNTVDEPLKSHRVNYALKAAILLEYGWSRSKSNSDFSLLLLRIYASLGCGFQAMKAYLRLSLKQIQLDTLGYSLLDRISSLHPHPFSSAPDGSSENHSPAAHFKKQQKMYRNTRGQVAQNTWKAFEHESYNTIFQFKEFSDIICKTISAVSTVTESKKIARLLKSDINIVESYGILPKNPELVENLSDTNDYASFPDYDSTSSIRFEKLTRYAPGPSVNRSRAQLLIERLISIIESDSKLKDADISLIKDNLLPAMDALLKQAGDVKASPEDFGFTRSEYSALAAFTNLAEVIVKAVTGAQDQSSLDASNKSLSTKLEEHLLFIHKCQNPTPALWDTLHILYTAYDLASTVTKATKYLSQPYIKAAKSQIEANKNLVEGAKRVMQAVEDKSKSTKNGLDESGWIDRVLESMEVGSLGEQLRGLVGENFVEEWAGEVVEGWRESVTGLGYLKI